MTPALSIILLHAAPAVGSPASPIASVARDAVYSNLCIERQSGDTAGHRITLHWEGPTVTVSFAWTEGAEMQPVTAVRTDYDARSGRLVFEATTPSGVASFHGRVDAAELKGDLRDGWEPNFRRVRLVRLRPSAEPPPYCAIGRSG